MFISKKKYQALLAERDRWEEVATETHATNSKLLSELSEMHAIAKTVNDHNGQLIKQNKLLKEARDYAAGMAEYYKELLESKTDYEAEEEGKYLTREAEE